MIYLLFMQHMKHRMHADNAITFRIWLDDKPWSLCSKRLIIVRRCISCLWLLHAAVHSPDKVWKFHQVLSADNTHLWYKKQARRRLRHLLLLSLI